jgi:hypothetical protein
MGEVVGQLNHFSEGQDLVMGRESRSHRKRGLPDRSSPRWEQSRLMPKNPQEGLEGVNRRVVFSRLNIGDPWLLRPGRLCEFTLAPPA